ncbi:MAG: beta-eliminating lyase-related protein [Bdellovibrionota bacterium]
MKKARLHGHYPILPKSFFQEMADYCSENQLSDFYGTGADLQNFENHLAKLFNKEAALFFPSGTMLQPCLARIICEKKNSKQIAFHSTSHLEIHEHKAYEKLHNLKAHLIGKQDQIFNLEDLKKIPKDTSLVLFELPQREIGGQLPEWKDLCAQIQYLKDKDIWCHLDGARIWECINFYQKSISEIADLFDSVYISFYKGIGAISGAALLGAQEIVDEAKLWNRRSGGNLITNFPVYLSCQKELASRIDRFPAYFKRAQQIVEILENLSEKIIIQPKKIQCNLFHIYIQLRADELNQKNEVFEKQNSFIGLRSFQAIEDKLSKREVYIGDGAMDLSDDLIKSYFEFLVS